MNRSYRIIGLIAIIAFSFRISAQDIEFYREDILFKIDTNAAYADGKYFFCNTGEKNRMMSLFYPFPDNTIEFIDSLYVENLEGGTMIPYRTSGSGIHFEIYLKSFGQTSFRVHYRQQQNTGHFRYILLSTKQWGRPLESVDYELQIPLSLTVDSLSYPPDTSFTSNSIRLFRWKKTNFMPGRDFEVFYH